LQPCAPARGSAVRSRSRDRAATPPACASSRRALVVRPACWWCGSTRRAARGRARRGEVALGPARMLASRGLFFLSAGARSAVVQSALAPRSAVARSHLAAQREPECAPTRRGRSASRARAARRQSADQRPRVSPRSDAMVFGHRDALDARRSFFLRAAPQRCLPRRATPPPRPLLQRLRLGFGALCSDTCWARGGALLRPSLSPCARGELGAEVLPRVWRCASGFLLQARSISACAERRSARVRPRAPLRANACSAAVRHATPAGSKNRHLRAEQCATWRSSSIGSTLGGGAAREPPPTRGPRLLDSSRSAGCP
jgi:hypothetical protein